MSDVARYTAAGDGVVRTDSAGPLVEWQDYARLKAEVERLRASSFVTAVPVEQYDRVVAGGELVLREWSMGDENGANNYLKALVIWNAAKEGKPSV